MTFHSTIPRHTSYEKLGYYEQQAFDLNMVRHEMAQHRMTIMHEDGPYRHIHMSRTDTFNRSFNITTVPGYLMFTGDVGSFTFSHLRDMFDFHRINWDQGQPTIDYGYWHKKVTAEDRHGKCDQYNGEAFKDAAVKEFREIIFPMGNRMKYWREFREEVIEHVGEDEREDRQRLYDWGADVAAAENRRAEQEVSCLRMAPPFQDFWDYSPFRIHSLRFRWACWAIALTIHHYDRGGDPITRQAAHDKLILEGKL